MASPSFSINSVLMTQMINGCWKACYEPDDVSGKSFAADAIISNPPAFAHVHCAEALGVPVLLSFSKASIYARYTPPDEYCIASLSDAMVFHVTRIPSLT